MKKTWRETLLVCCAASLCTVTWWHITAEAVAARPHSQEMTVIETTATLATDFTLREVSGRLVSLRNLRGRVVLLNFWASWCGYCLKELPLLEGLHQQYQTQGLTILGATAESSEDVGEFWQNNGYSFPALLDNEAQVRKQYGATAVPTTIIIGRDGQIIARFVGLQNEATLQSALIRAGLNPVTGRQESTP